MEQKSYSKEQRQEIERRRQHMREERQARQRRRRRLKRIRNLLLLLVILLVVLIVIQKFPKTVSQEQETAAEEQVFHALDDVESDRAVITKYDTYGTSLNLEGNVELEEAASVQSMYLVLRESYTVLEGTQDDEELAVDENEGAAQSESDFNADSSDSSDSQETEVTSVSYPLVTSTDNNQVSFYISSDINDGICLETLSEGTYCMVLEVNYNTGTQEYLSLQDASNEEAITYYTITKNGSNDCIQIGFDSYTAEGSSDALSYLSVNSSSSTLPDDVYDVVIDAGHGGTDSGAVNGDYTEAELTLSYALALKTSLEDIGLKVLLTRDGTESADIATAYTMYDTDGRVNVAAGSGAKYCLCLHLNSNQENVSISGVQIYCSNRGNTELAQAFADNIVSFTGTTYSGMETYKVANGVYQRAYSESDIADANASADKHGYAYYDITTDTDYFYMIRELGGIATNAYVDGRNTIYGTNEYLNSNTGVETFLMELGYLSESVDLNNLVSNKDAYISAIQSALQQTIEKFN